MKCIINTGNRKIFYYDFAKAIVKKESVEYCFEIKSDKMNRAAKRLALKYFKK